MMSRTCTSAQDQTTLDVPGGVQPVKEAARVSLSWRSVLQRMEQMAAARGQAHAIYESRSSACINFLEANGCVLSEMVNALLMSRIFEALSGEGLGKVSGLVLPNTSADVYGALDDFILAYSDMRCSARNESKNPVVEAVMETPSDNYRIGSHSPSVNGNGNAFGLALSLTYAELIRAHELGRPGIKKKTIQNETSALHRLMNIRGETGSSECRWLADPKEFDEHLSEANITDEKLRSALNKIRATASTLVELRNPANNLWESYLRLHRRHVNVGGKTELLTKNAFLQFCFHATGMSRKRLNAQTILVHGPTFDRIKDLEHSLGGNGELTQWLINMSDDNARTFQTEYGKRLSKASRFPYSLALEKWSNELKQEWDDLHLLRTEPLKASRRWGLHLENVPKKKLYKWKIRQHGECPSARKQRRELESFFGWCLLPKVLLPNGRKNVWRSGPDRTITQEQLTLALVTDQDLFDGYLAFRIAHTLTEEQATAGERGKFNRSCKTFIEFTSSLLNPLTGFIYLRRDLYFTPADLDGSPRNLAPRVGTKFYNMDLRRAVTVTDDDERWLCFCKKIRSYMELTREQEFDPAVVTRGRDPIASILALDDPMKAICELLHKLKISEPVRNYWREYHRRKILFFTLISLCPLRIFQFSLMTGRHLYRVDATNGRKAFYQIHFRKDEFKNERFIAEQDYWFNLPEDLTTFFDEYFAKVWPVLNSRVFTKDDRVFQASCKVIRKTQHAPSQAELSERIASQLEKLCKITTARLLGAKYQTPGFYPHALRHIKATSIIRITNSYEEAALVLWDAIETVKREYSHVTRAEQLAKASRADYQRMKANPVLDETGAVSAITFR